MSDYETVKIEVSITKDTYDQLVRLTKRQNAQLDNNVDRFIQEGIDATYARHPNLFEDNDNE